MHLQMLHKVKDGNGDLVLSCIMVNDNQNTRRKMKCIVYLCDFDVWYLFVL